MKKENRWTTSLGGLVLIILVVGLVLTRGGLAPQEPAKETLETQGFSEIEITDRDWFVVSLRGCTGSDSAKFHATAVNPAGERVKVTVCAAWPFGGYTVRQ